MAGTQATLTPGAASELRRSDTLHYNTAHVGDVINAQAIAVPGAFEFGPGAANPNFQAVNSVTVAVQTVGDAAANGGRGSVTINHNSGVAPEVGLAPGTYTYEIGDDNDRLTGDANVDFVRITLANANDDVTFLVRYA